MDNLRQFSSSSHEWLAYLMHDLRDPLDRISLAIHPLEALTAEGQTSSREQLIQLAQAIRGELIEANALIAGIGSHVALEDAQPNFVPVYVNSLIEHLVSRLQPDANIKEIELDCQPPQGALCVHGDFGLLNRAFQNLISNAIQYTPKLGLVAVETAALDGWVRVTISDNGPGIPQSVLPWLFEPGFRIGSGPMDKLDGRGLGLAFVRRVVDIHRGRVSVDHRSDDEGSCFIVELPVIEEPSQNN
jgi:signal transduction histidine kinase